MPWQGQAGTRGKARRPRGVRRIGPHGGDRLGEIQRAARRYRQDGYLIIPLSIEPGDGFLPAWYPACMARPWQPEQWAYDARRNVWSRAYAEVKPAPGMLR